MRFEELFSFLKSDFLRYRNVFSYGAYLRLFLDHPGFRSTVLIRISNFFYFRGIYSCAARIRKRLVSRFGIDAVPGCKIGPGLRIEHTFGIVIGKYVEIGQGLTIMHCVTIGEKYLDHRSNKKYPVLGDNVNIGVGSVILGDIQIGSNVTIGALTLVLRSIPDGETAIGRS